MSDHPIDRNAVNNNIENQQLLDAAMDKTRTQAKDNRPKSTAGQYDRVQAHWKVIMLVLIIEILQYNGL